MAQKNVNFHCLRRRTVWNFTASVIVLKSHSTTSTHLLRGHASLHYAAACVFTMGYLVRSCYSTKGHMWPWAAAATAAVKRHHQHCCSPAAQKAAVLSLEAQTPSFPLHSVQGQGRINMPPLCRWVPAQCISMHVAPHHLPRPQRHSKCGIVCGVISK